MRRKYWFRFGLSILTCAVVNYLLFGHAAVVGSFGLMGATMAVVAPLPLSNRLLRRVGVSIMVIAALLPAVLAVEFQAIDSRAGFLSAAWVLSVGLSTMLVSFPDTLAQDPLHPGSGIPDSAADEAR